MVPNVSFEDGTVVLVLTVQRHCLPFKFKDSIISLMVILGFTFDRKHYGFYGLTSAPLKYYSER